MSELFNNFSLENTQDILTDWGSQFVGAEFLQREGLLGSGIKIAVVDPNTSYSMGGPSSKAQEVHGYGIAGLIKCLLPQAEIVLLKGDTPQTILQGFIQAIDYGANVINLSLARPTMPSEAKTDALFHDIVNHALRGNKSINFEAASREHRQLTQEATTITMVQTYLERAMEKAREQGINVVAASGYGYDKPEKTFGIYSEVLVVGGFDEGLKPLDTTPGIDVDVYAPGVGIRLPAGPFKTQVHTGNSFAAPFVTVACAVGQEILGRQPQLVQNYILASSNNINGMQSIDYGALLKLLLQ